MKKVISTFIVVVIIVTPCLANQVEPDGIIGITNTLWTNLGKFFYLGFYNSEVYLCFFDPALADALSEFLY